VTTRADGHFVARAPRGRAFAAAAFGGVAVLALLVRLPSVAEPLGIDQGLWASAARAMARGQLLYRDVWDQKPPAIFLTYLAAFTTLGWTPASIAWLDIAASILTTALLFAAVRRLGDTLMGAAAAALYAALTVPSWLFRYGGFLDRSVAETFIGVCVAAGAWCAVRLKDTASTPAAIGLGVAAGAAVAFKPNAGVYLPALLVWIACYVRRPGARLLQSVCLAALGAAVIPAAMLFWLWRLGVLPDAKVALLDFNRFYVAQDFNARTFAIDFAKAVWFRVKSDPLWLAGAVGALAALLDFVRSRRVDPVPALALSWGGAAAIVIAANGNRLFSTYFLQAHPPLAVLAAWLIVRGPRAPPAHRLFAAAAVVVMAVLLAGRNYPARVYETARADVVQLAQRGDPVRYLERFGGYATGRGYSARANAEVADYVRSHTGPDETIYEFGLQSGIYFYADRLPAHRFLRVNEFVPTTFPDPDFTLGAVTRELAARRPAYLVFEVVHTGTVMGNAVDHLLEQPEIQRLLQDYHLDSRIEDFTLFRRRSSLAARASAGSVQ
jgi:hypothetical protein